jgi:endonuclease III
MPGSRRTSRIGAGCARRVVTQYGGEAGRIWGDRPSARQLFQRLDEFDGIGQKKAAMAVEILERDLSVPVEDMHGSDIAYDVHVRRVFLRTEVARYDDLDHMLDVARTAHPQRPGAIDYPAWLVGRQWCRLGVPNCADCVLTNACPKLVSAAASVRGA